MKTYAELLADFRAAAARVDGARARFRDELPTEGIRLTSHPGLRKLHEDIRAAEQAEGDAREALLSYRGE